MQFNLVEELWSLASNGNKSPMSNIEYFKLPCHTQAVERCVKIVSEAAGKVAGSESRNGYIRVKLQSQNIMPNFNSKRDYKM